MSGNPITRVKTADQTRGAVTHAYCGECPSCKGWDAVAAAYRSPSIESDECCCGQCAPAHPAPENGGLSATRYAVPALWREPPAPPPMDEYLYFKSPADLERNNRELTELGLNRAPSADLDWRSKHEPSCPTLHEEQRCTCGCRAVDAWQEALDAGRLAPYPGLIEDTPGGGVTITFDAPHPPEGFKWDDGPEREAVAEAHQRGLRESWAAMVAPVLQKFLADVDEVYGSSEPDIMAATRDVARGS